MAPPPALPPALNKPICAEPLVCVNLEYPLPSDESNELLSAKEN